MVTIANQQTQEQLLSYGLTPLPPPKTTNARAAKWDNPATLEEHPAGQEAFHCLSLRDPVRAQIITEQLVDTALPTEKKVRKKAALNVTEQKINELGNPLALLANYQDLIQHHVALRTALFFQQAVACYNTPFHYRIAKTEGQFFNAPTLEVIEGKPLANELVGPSDKENLKTVTVPYQAAHSGTIPGLEACWRSDFEQEGALARYFTYLQGSLLEVDNNSTIGFPRFVNQIDSLIDGKSSQTSELRGLAINLLNLVAMAQLSPTDATRQFLADLEHKLHTRPQASKRMTPEKRQVINLYLEQVGHMIRQAQVPDSIDKKNPFFDDQLNVNLSRENKDDIAKIREIVYQRKFEIIRLHQVLETQIHALIDRAFPGLDHVGKNNVWHCLILAEADTALKRTLEKIFCISQQATLADRPFVDTLFNRFKQNPTAYNNLLRDLRELVRSFQTAEQGFQANLLKNFRVELRKLTQIALSQKIKDVVKSKIASQLKKPTPNYYKIAQLQAMPDSPSSISRLENNRFHVIGGFKTPANQRRKELNLRHAKVIAKALEVQAGHFFCSFPASREV